MPRCPEALPCCKREALPGTKTQSMQFLQCRSCSAACQAWPLATVAPCLAVPPCRLLKLQALRPVTDRQSCGMQCPMRGRAGTHTPAQIMRSCRRASAQWARPGWRIASSSRWVRQTAAPQARPSFCDLCLSRSHVPPAPGSHRPGCHAAQQGTPHRLLLQPPACHCSALVCHVS